jgi:hypothetical protein
MNIPASALSMCLVTGLAPLCVASTIYVDVDDLAALVTGYGDELLDADDREDCTRDGSVDVVDLMGMLGQ